MGKRYEELYSELKDLEAEIAEDCAKLEPQIEFSHYRFSTLLEYVLNDANSPHTRLEYDEEDFRQHTANAGETPDRPENIYFRLKRGCEISKKWKQDMNASFRLMAEAVSTYEGRAAHEGAMPKGYAQMAASGKALVFDGMLFVPGMIILKDDRYNGHITCFMKQVSDEGPRWGEFVGTRNEPRRDEEIDSMSDRDLSDFYYTRDPASFFGDFKGCEMYYPGDPGYEKVCRKLARIEDRLASDPSIVANSRRQLKYFGLDCVAAYRTK